MANIHEEKIYSGTFSVTDIINLANFTSHMSKYDQPEWSAICGYIQQETGIDFEELFDNIRTVVNFMTAHLV